jgi:hypothetical protein
MHQLTSLAPEIIVREQNRAQVVAEELGAHGQIRPAGINVASSPEKIVGDSLGRHNDVTVACKREAVERAILICPLLEL